MNQKAPSTTRLIESFLAQTTEYAIICMDPAGTVSAWLGAAQAMFEFHEEEILGRNVALIFTQEDRDKGIPQQELGAASAGSRSENDRWHLRKDGSRIWVTGSVQAVRDTCGELLGFIKIARDRTDLQTRIEHQENQLDEQERAAARINAFFRTFGHELRNPLTPLRNSASILRATSDDGKVQRVASIIDNQVDALQRMADDLVDVAGLSDGNITLNLTPIDVRDMLASVCDAFQVTARSKNIEITTVLPGAAMRAMIDPARFQQVLQNLLSNAIKYTPPAGRVWLKVTQEESDVVIRVEDTGVGIDAEKLPRLFDLFTRAAVGKQLEPSGMGVGLSVVKELVELHGGSAQARSLGTDKGSIFTVRLPSLDSAVTSP